MDNSRELKLAVLIDADNVPYANVKEMFEEIAKYGTPTFKRIYADWTKPTVSGWKKVLLENAISPVQQYSYSTGKMRLTVHSSLMRWIFYTQARSMVSALFQVTAILPGLQQGSGKPV